jgi:cytoskeletal protein RodZ
MDPSADPPGHDEAERERRRRLLRQLEGASRSPLQQGPLPRALRAISIALALLGLAAWWFVTQEQKRQAEEAEAAPPAAASAPSAPAKPSAANEGKSQPVTPADTDGTTKAASTAKPAAASTAQPAVGSFDRDRGRPLDRDRPQER